VIKRNGLLSSAFSNTVSNKKFTYNLVSESRMIMHCKWRGILKKAVFVYITESTTFATQFPLFRMDWKSSQLVRFFLEELVMNLVWKWLCWLVYMECFSPSGCLKQTTVTSLYFIHRHLTVLYSTLHPFNNKSSVGKKTSKLRTVACYWCYLWSLLCKFTCLVT
jgi:hypothetical protein